MGEGMLYYARVEGKKESMLKPEEEAGTSMKDEKKEEEWWIKHMNG